MTITEVLHLVDKLFEKKTGEHLDDLQKSIIRGLWQGKTYGEIANECGYDSKNYIGDVSRKLFKVLSEQLDEDIKKSNFSWTLERVINSPQFVNLVNSNITWCSPSNEAKTDQNITDEEKIKNNIRYQDLTIAPKITHFYDRATELQNLSHWITNQNARLISVLGLSGIGKTTLVKQFVDLNLEQFDVVVWKSIKLSQSLDSIITEISTAVNSSHILADNKFNQIFNILRQQRCLIVFDDVQELFVSKQLAGQYKSEYKDYQTLFARIVEIEHQSSLILISQEQCREMTCSNDESNSTKCLELEGLKNAEILKAQGLKDETECLRLVDLYEGNPVYLQDIASLIKNIFLGKPSRFLIEDSLILTEDMKSQLDDLFERLSIIEKQIVLKLSQYDLPINIEILRQSIELSSTNLINGLQSLSRRYLLKKIAGEDLLFTLSPVVREYVKTI